MKKISVVCTAYNIDKYISKCLNSILSQTFTNYEVIIVDDGSTDNTLKICKKFEKKYDNIKVYSKKNEGPSEARNFGLKYVTGDYFIFADGDDEMDPKTLEYLYSMINKTKSDIAICEFEKFYEKYKNVPDELVYNIYTSKEYLRDLLLLKRNTYTWGVLYSKKFKDVISFPKGKYYEDLAVMYKIFDLSNLICHTPLQLIKYRQLNTSIVHTNNVRKINDFEFYAEEMCNYILNKYNELNEFVNMYLCNAYMNCLYMSIGLDNKDKKNFYKMYIKNNIKKCNFKYVPKELKSKFILYRISPSLGYFFQVIKRKALK